MSWGEVRWGELGSGRVQFSGTHSSHSSRLPSPIDLAILRASSKEKMRWGERILGCTDRPTPPNRQTPALSCTASGATEKTAAECIRRFVQNNK